MISCSVSVSDERTASAVRAVLSLCGIGAENGTILITDSPGTDISQYAGAVVLSHSRIVPEESGRVKILSLPLDYSGLIDALNSLAGMTGEPVDVHAAVTDVKEHPVLHDGVISWRGKSVQLTERESMLLEYLCACGGRIVPRDEIVNAVWNGYDGTANVADVYISYLRKKLVPLFGQGVLVTVRGQGYMLNLP